MFEQPSPPCCDTATQESAYLHDGKRLVHRVVAGLELREPVACLPGAGTTLVQEGLDVPLHQRSAGGRRRGFERSWRRCPRRLFDGRRLATTLRALGVLCASPGSAETASWAGALRPAPPRAIAQPPGAPRTSRAAQPSGRSSRPQGCGYPCCRHDDNQTHSPPHPQVAVGLERTALGGFLTCG